MKNFTRLKNFVLFWTFLLLFITFTGLTANAATLAVSKSTISAGYGYSKVTIDVTADADWTINTPADWMDFSNYGYEYGSGTVTINIYPNNMSTSRIGVITISANGETDKTVTVTQAAVTADIFETNDTELTATIPSLVFNNDVADLILNEESLHTITDVDYYKLNLPTGYSYCISSDLYDSDNSNKNSNFYYSLDAKYSYKINTNAWSSTSDSKISDFQLSNGGIVLFNIKSYSAGFIGTYGLHLRITRSLGTPALTVSSNNISIGAAQNSTSTINITSNTNWSIRNTNSWFSVSPTSGTNNAIITITADANTSQSSKLNSFSIISNGLVSSSVSVNQPLKDLTPDTYEPNNLESTAKELILSYSGNQARIITNGANIYPAYELDYYKINLSALNSYGITALIHDYDEISKNVDLKVSYKIGAAGTWSTAFDKIIPDFSYVGGDYIYFKVESYFLGDKGDYSLEFIINKNTAAPTFDLSVTSLSIIADESITSTFNVISNSGWNITSSSPWLSISPSSGWGNTTVTIHAASNISSNSRIATITAICPLMPNKTISITQASGGFPFADSYEPNEIESAAKELVLSFVNDNAILKTVGATIHSTTDIDYYKIVLPAGYKYSISSKLYDTDNSSDNNYYNLDAGYAIKNGSTWTSRYDIQPINYSDGNTTVYFKVVPYALSSIGNYALELNISRSVSSATLDVSNSTFYISEVSSNSTKFDITSSGTTWSITSDQPWLTVNNASGTGNAQIIITANQNGNIAPRTAILTVKANGIASKTVTINQSGQNDLADIYENNNTEATAFNANITFNDDWANFNTVEANINTTTDIDFYKINLPLGYKYTISNFLNRDVYSNYLPSLIAYKVGSGGTWSSSLYDYNVEIPTITSANNTEIFIKVSPATNGTKGKYQLQTSINRAAITLSLSKSAISMANNVATSSFDVTSNTTWTVVSAETWLTTNTSAGSNNGTITLSASANPNSSTRSSIVTISGSGITKTITVTQDAAIAILDVSTATLNIAELASSTAAFDITSNIAWTVVSAETWLTPSLASGLNNGSITLTAIANPTTSLRSSIVTIAGSGITKTITVTQKAGAATALDVSTATLNIAELASSTAAFDITSNIAWTVVSAETWLTPSLASGSNNGSITLTAIANPSTSTRSSIVTIAGSGITKTITVTQNAAASALNVSTTTLSVPETAGSTASFDITSNISWTVVSPDSWLNINTASGSNNATITLTAPANTGATPRNATITISGSGITKTITLTQAAVITLDLSATTLNVTADANSTSTFNITSNSTWTVKSAETWLNVNTPSGSNNATITVTADANGTLIPRNAVVTVTIGSITKTITITQNGKTDGIDNKIVKNLKFYPNPVIDKLSIELANESGLTNIFIINSEGALKATEVQKNKNFEIDMTQFSSGFYFIKLVSAEGAQTIKVFKD